MISGFETSVLSDPVTPQELATETGSAPPRSSGKALYVGVGAAALLVWLACSLGIAAAVVDSFDLETSFVNIGSIIFGCGVIAAVIGFIFQAPREDPKMRAVRLRRFTEHNDLRYKEVPNVPELSGSIFRQGHHHSSAQRFRNGPSHALPFEIAHFSYQTGTTGRNERPSVTSWTYLAITADRELPGMLLDSKSNDAWYGSSLPDSYAKSQIVPLGDDLGRRFTLYAPEGHEADARRIFSTNVLTRLHQDAPEFDVEVVGKQIILFTRKKFDLSTEAAWEQLSRLVFGVGTTMVGLTDDADNRFSVQRTKPLTATNRTLRKRRIAPSTLWLLAAGAVLVLARVLFTEPLEGLV